MSDSWDDDGAVDVIEADVEQVGGEFSPRNLSFVDAATQQVVDVHVPLSTDEARELTERIRSAADVLYVLIYRAHAGRAWEALGYSSFGDYVREEFDISRSRAYQLLNQAKVVEVIEAAAPDGTDIHISEAAARDLKSVIGEVVPEIEERTRDLTPNEAADVIDEVIEEHRERARESREQREQDAFDDEMDAAAKADRDGFSDNSGGGYTPPPPPPIYDDEDDIDPVLIRRNVQAAYDLYSSLAALKGMPDIQSVIDTIPVERRLQINESLPTAAEWLSEFKDLWFVQVWQTEVAGEYGGGGSDD